MAAFTFAGWRPERKPELTWEYVAKTSLVASPKRSSDRIQVLYDGREVEQLTTISGRLTNTGTAAVGTQNGEIEQFPTLKFDDKRVRIVSAKIVRRTPEGIRAKAIVEGDTVRIEHGIVNAGDVLTVEVLLEGDPGDTQGLPKLAFRIGGISKPSTLYPQTTGRAVRIGYFEFSRTAEYALLGFCSLAVGFLFLVVFAGCAQLKSELFPSEASVQVIQESVNNVFEKIDRTQPLERLRGTLANELWQCLPKVLDEEVRDAVGKLPVDSTMQVQYFLDVARQTTAEKMRPSFRRHWRNVDTTTLLLVLSFLVASLALGLLLAGSWHTLLYFR